jgi:hypothetical protein
MEPVLLYTDTDSITKTQTIIANAVPVYQGIYNAIIAVGVTTPTLAEIKSLIEQAAKQSVSNADAVFGINGLANLATDFTTNYVKNKLVKQAMPYVVNGISWPAAKVAEIITVPNITGIITALQPVWGFNSQKVFIERHLEYFTYLTLAANVVGVVANAAATIAGIFTYYSQNDTSTALATSIQTMCDALNTYVTTYPAINIIQNFKTGSQLPGNAGARTVVPGVVLQYQTGFAIDYDFVKKFERYNKILGDMI